MARLLGPDPNTRTAWRNVGGFFKTAAGGIAVFYTDAAGSALADVRYYDPLTPATPGGVISGSALPVDYKSEYPIFWFPDGVDVLYVSIDGGPLTEVHAGYDARIDALAAAGETAAGAQAKADAAQAAATSAAATDATTKAATAQAAAISAAATDATTKATAAQSNAISAAATDATTKANAAAAAALAGSADRNLTNLTSAATARTNLGLGAAATLSVGTTAGTVAAGDDSRFAASSTRSSIVGSRQMIGTRLSRGATVQAPQNAPATFRIRHISTVACADLRLVYGAPLNSEADGATQPITIKVGLEYAGATYPVSWQGRSTATFDPGGVAVISDPIPVELPAGATFWTRCYVRTDFGSYVTLSPSGVSAGATTLSLSGLPGGGLGTTGLITIESPREQVTVLSYTGSSAPYTANLSGTVPSAHSAGAVVGGTTFSNVISRADYGEASATTDQSWTTAAMTTVNNLVTTTLTANVNPGDTSIKVAAPMVGASWTIGAETVVIRNIGGSANPYTAYLVSPVVGTYTSGATVTTTLGAGSALAPVAIVADRVSSTPPAAIVVLGDSIPNGVGYSVLPESSYMTAALEAANRAYQMLTKSGESAQQFAAVATSRRRRTLISLAPWAIYAYGVNDVYGSRSLAQVQADTTTIIGWLKQRGLKVAVATLTPRTTSTDGWVTTGNQTIVNSGTHNAVRLQYNAWVRAGAGGLADLVLELADTVETARDSGIWKADASGPYTTDGIHPTYAGHMSLLKPAIDAALPLMT